RGTRDSWRDRQAGEKDLAGGDLDLGDKVDRNVHRPAGHVGPDVEANPVVDIIAGGIFTLHHQRLGVQARLVPAKSIAQMLRDIVHADLLAGQIGDVGQAVI